MNQWQIAMSFLEKSEKVVSVHLKENYHKGNKNDQNSINNLVFINLL
ncbi:hypothetical protein [Flavisolibacter tropicus]|nr:hypothetical protein [Flavisolibacter tropicus]